MTPSARMRAHNLPVRWTTLLVGWDGPGRLVRQIDIPEIASYAKAQLEAETCGHDEFDLVVDLAVAGLRDSEAVGDNLRKLAAIERGDVAFETRKWRLVLLQSLLEHLREDHLEGILELASFWLDFDLPFDGPEEPCTEANYCRLVARLEEWFKKEKQLLGGQ